MDKLILVVLLVSIVNAAIPARHAQGYYWRDFEGSLPEDALPGGLDRNAKPIYIGQVLFEGKLIPGKICEGDSNIYFEWNQKEKSESKNVKILCSRYPEKFEWIQTKVDELVLLTNRLLVKGGFEPGYFTYIGRLYLGEETTVGQVLCRDTDCLGLYITKNGKGIEYKGAFEVLTYNPKINVADTDCNISIDNAITELSHNIGRNPLSLYEELDPTGRRWILRKTELLIMPTGSCLLRCVRCSNSTECQREIEKAAN